MGSFVDYIWSKLSERALFKFKQLKNIEFCNWFKITKRIDSSKLFKKNSLFNITGIIMGI